MIFRVFTESCNHHYCQISEYLHHPPQKNTHTPSVVTTTPFPAIPQPLVTTSLAVSIHLPVLGISHQQNHAFYGILCLDLDRV